MTSHKKIYVIIPLIIINMIECIDLAFDHILLAPNSNRKRNRENDDVVDEAAVDNISSKRSSSSRSSRKNAMNEDDVVCTVIKAMSGSRKCIHNRNKSVRSVEIVRYSNIIID